MNETRREASLNVYWASVADELPSLDQLDTFYLGVDGQLRWSGIDADWGWSLCVNFELNGKRQKKHLLNAMLIYFCF